VGRAEVGLRVLTRSGDGEVACSWSLVVMWLVVTPGLPWAPAVWLFVVSGCMDLVGGPSVVLLKP